MRKTMRKTTKSIFDEQYRVVAIEGDCLLIHPEPQAPLNQRDYPPGKLIALSDPFTAPPN
jgi:hypothetical protein